ncbi:MAG: fasciclin domain-containing protein [Sphingomicrobium sp.]
MTKLTTAVALGAAFLALGACDNQGGANGSAQTSEAKNAAGTKTVAAGLNANGRFMGAAKAAGLDQTLAGPGPYTVIVADDAAFTALTPGTYDNWLKPENRAQLTGVMTNMILPGTVLAEDISKAIDNGKGKAVLATMGGGTLTATKEGSKIVLASASGKKAVVTQADDKFTNGVVHHVDGVLM